MIPDLKIPILLQEVHSIDYDILEIQDRVEKRAYEKFLDRGSSHGFELEDWLAAEKELIVPSRVGVRVDDSRVVVEMFLPNIDPTGLYVSATPHDVLILSTVDGAGCQVFQAVHFPEEVELSGVTAEHVLDTLFVTAMTCVGHGALRAVQVA
ncbi:MAG TPA: DUF2934 domain-containing protein [Terriglobia bacterium]|nr:DUF2934 domain-containing protein [Terriglobia bacterium]